MNLRLKNMELNSFRAFENRVQFDFINDKFKEVSNLIVIYAPNGTGKTSFFDAIEWSLSGEIKRISENKPVKEIANKERNYILKNKYSQAEAGLVKLQFEDDSLYEIETKKLNLRRTIDYAPGKELTKTVQLSKDTLKNVIDKNMLTHDQIDSFLRFKNAEQRYDALSIFWDKDKQSEDYKNIDLIICEMIKQKVQQIKIIKDIEEKIQKDEVNPEIWNEINNLKEIYRSLDEEADMIVEKKLSLQELYFESTKLLSLNKNKISDTKSKITDLKKLAKEMKEEYKDIPQNILTLKKLVSEQTKLLNIFLKLDEIEKKRQRLLDKKIKLSEEIKRSTFIVEYTPNFIIQREELEKLKNEEKNLISTRKEVEEKKNLLQIEMQKEDLILTDFIKIDATLNKELSEIIMLKNYPIIQENVKKLNKELSEIKNQKKILENLLNTDILQVSKLNKIYSLEEFQILQKDYSEDKDYNFIKGKLRHASEIFSRIKVYKKELKQKKDELEYVKKLGSDIEKLKKVGYSIVSSTKSSLCPLCLHDFEEFEKIIESINDNKTNLSRTTDLTNEIKILETKLKIDDSKLEVAVKEIKQDINTEINRLDGKIEKNNKESIILDSTRKNKEQEYNRIEIEEKKLLELMNRFEIQIKELGFQISTKETLLKSKIEKNNLEYSKLEKKRIEQEKIYTEQENLLANIITTKEQNKRKISDIEDNNQYILYQKEINFYDNLGIINISDYLRIKESDLENVQEKEIEFIKEKKVLEEKIKGNEKKDVVGKINECEKGILELELRKSIIEQDSINIYDELVIEENRFEISVKELTKKISKFEKKNEVLSQISGLSISYLSETKIEDKKKNLINQKKIKDNLEITLGELSQLKTTKLNEIKKKIKDTFNLDMVNQIFQMIEPHPEFKEISFKINENDSDKLGLDIMCKKENEEESAPILYLSSAQVNILSLSIFLGIALENTDRMNTILMDDPIQHLDSLNELSFIDLLRVISFKLGKQVIFSTHNQHFYNLCKRKLDCNYHNSSFFDISKMIQS